MATPGVTDNENVVRNGDGTIIQALQRTAKEHPDLVALRTPDDTVSLTWAEVGSRSNAIAHGLRDLGLGRGDAAALMLANRPEFHLTDLAILALGATPFSVYNTLPAGQIAYLLANSGAKLVVTEHQFLDLVLAAAADVPAIEQIVLLEDDGPDGTVPWRRLEAGGSEELIVECGPEDVATLIYTSGTTGPPKGVELTHANVIAEVQGLAEVLRLEPGDRVICWLPLAHIAERVASYYFAIASGLTVTFCDDMTRVGAVLAEAHPSWFFAVPRVWEKLKAGVEAAVEGLPDDSRKVLEAAIADRLDHVRLEQAGEDAPPELRQRSDAALEALAPLRQKLGLHRADAMHAGGAPPADDVLIFFSALGLPVGGLWGMSELCGCATLERPGPIRVGSVGPPIGGVEVRLDTDGELLVRGPIVMRGYRGEPEKTRETVDRDGWLRTGDLATIDEDGSVRIVGRKKEIMVTAAGKNLSPANIEGAIGAQSSVIAFICAVGDRQPYVAALVVVDRERVEALGLGPDEVIAEVGRAVELGNASLHRAEQVKRFRILDREWFPGGDELTPTLKLKRQAIVDKYSAEIAALYDGKK